MLFTRDLAVHVAGLYWRQVRPYGATASGLRQIRGSRVRASIVEAVRTFWEQAGGGSLAAAQQRFPGDWEHAVDTVEMTLARQPLPRLQTVGGGDRSFPFLYDLDWGPQESVSVMKLRRHGARGAPVRLRPGSGDQLLRLAPLVRPLVELHWVRLVAELSGIDTETERLHRHLFGAPRVALPAGLRAGLGDLQEGRCFYCGEALPGGSEADHVIARVRGGDDAIENLVLADQPCNNNKRDLLPSPSLVTRWADRNRAHGRVLTELAAAAGWPSDPRGALSVARSVYGHLPAGDRPFWAGLGSIELVSVGDALKHLLLD